MLDPVNGAGRVSEAEDLVRDHVLERLAGEQAAGVVGTAHR
ncbi:MAG: hypothetical protein OXB99_01860 [Acidimicrobiaceae bacterium]|nr:hypothetical protein [Acidimicrobiaceae bacterium]